MKRLATRLLMSKRSIFTRLTIGAAMMGCLAAPALAETTILGAVEFGEPNSGDVTVGFADDSNDFAFGQLFIEGGGAETFGEFVVGNEPLAIGEVVVTGPNTSLTLTESGLASGQALIVGEEGNGTLTVSDGALLTVTNTSSGTFEIGEQPTGFGRVFIDGRSSTGIPTRQVVSENIIVGGAGIGELTISGGALAYQSEVETATLTIGELATGRGLVNLTGANTFWQAPQLVNIGVVGSGELRIGDGATFDADNGLLDPGATVTVGTRGFVNLEGGRFFVESATISGRLGGSGFVSGPITVAGEGEISTDPGDFLQFNGDVANTGGLINITGTPENRSEIEFLSGLTNTAAALPGRIAVSDGILRVGQTFTNNGTLSSAGGDTDFHGEIINAAGGQIVVGNQSTATFFDNVVVPVGTLSVAAGSTALFLGDIAISAGSTLEIGVNESSVTDGFEAPVQVLGSASFDGPIALALEDGFIPSEGDQIQLIEATDGISIDALATQGFDLLPSGLEWEILVNESGVIAQVIAAPIVTNVFTGDLNADGIVNAADFTSARDTGDDFGVAEVLTSFNSLASTASGLAALSTTELTAVPEPTTAVLLLTALAAPAFFRRR